MRVEVSSFVERDLESIADWIAAGSPNRALTFLEEIQVAIRRIGANPGDLPAAT